MADEKTSDYTLEANPTGKLLLDLANPGDKNYKTTLGDNPADIFNTISKTIMGAINELESGKAGLADNQTFTGNNTFSTGLLSNGLITISQPGPKSVVLGDGQVVTSGIVSCDTPTNDRHAGNRGYITSNQKNAYYFGNNGDDGKDGKSLQERKLTADGAIAAANGQSPPPSGTNRVNIYGIDGGDNTKFSLTGAGFVSLISPSGSFGVITTSSSSDGIVIADGYTAKLGFVRHALAGSGDQSGILVKCEAGANATHVDIRQIFNSTIYDDVLFRSDGDLVFAKIIDLRQGVSRDSTAIYVASGILILSENDRAIGKIIVANGANAYINSMYFDGDIDALGSNSFIDISGKYWNGEDLTNPETGGTVITNFNTHVIPS